MLAAHFDQMWPLDGFLLPPVESTAAATAHLFKTLGEVNSEQEVDLFLGKSESQRFHFQVVQASELTFSHINPDFLRATGQ